MADPETPAAPSGTVLVVDAAARSVLMLRRHASLRFMGGYWVFPGGALDPADVAHAGPGASAAAAAACAACRELDEEAGLQLTPAELVHWAHWITPSAARRRFDTHFFVALRPAGQLARLASDESTELRWVDPGWVAAAPPEFPVTPPTTFELRSLAGVLRDALTAAAFMQLARARAVRCVLPKLVDGMAVMPWDAEYSALPGEGLDWDAAARAERAGWPSRLPAVVAPRQ